MGNPEHRGGTRAPGNGTGEEVDYPRARRRMVDTQVVARGLREPRVLGALLAVRRHLFVEDALRTRAYDDHPLPIGEHQTISQPYMVAAMTTALNLTGTERVLEIGTGSGYQTAVLAEIVRQVVSIERHRALATKAAQLLADLGYTNVTVTCGDGTRGLPEYAPYDAILIAAGAPKIPDVLVPQLAEGGRLIVPVGDRRGQVLTRLTRYGNRHQIDTLDSCTFVELIGEFGWPER
ncbi:MAG: protein-L-isoaspartate(D-aspartate) O-methyltransferase [Deltaproteobacteria bacterium]|nr:protein-L-isoaspartate(D-aspartate) O-methyltransferase [Deltaproteobacteria bacterium]